MQFGPAALLSLPLFLWKMEKEKEGMRIGVKEGGGGGKV